MIPEMQDTRSTTYALEGKGLTLRKGDYTILSDVSFRLEQGTFAALVGPSGCGKTSLLRTLALLDAPAEGVVHFWGKEPEQKRGSVWLGNDRFYPQITYVPQTLALWPHMTIRENILFATNESSQIYSNLERLCKYLEISTILDRKPPLVSQGQRQRCALVRALLLAPTILLLDEITAALDENIAKNVWNLPRSFADDGGSILASTHSGRLASACDYCFRIRNKSLYLEREWKATPHLW
jgi:ABC-type lipoprotein export system ATPase subunit